MTLIIFLTQILEQLIYSITNLFGSLIIKVVKFSY